jgi:antitoxin CptB
MHDLELLRKRRKQLRYRANHRGIKEMDIILGKYADHFIERLDMDELDRFENLMEQSDRDLLQWFTYEKPLPFEFDTGLFEQILNLASLNINAEQSRKKIG